MSNNNEDYRVPVADEIKANMNEIGKAIAKSLPPGYGFALMIFEFGMGGTTAWMSNANRVDMIKALEEFRVTLNTGQGDSKDSEDAGTDTD